MQPLRQAKQKEVTEATPNNNPASSTATAAKPTTSKKKSCGKPSVPSKKMKLVLDPDTSKVDAPDDIPLIAAGADDDLKPAAKKKSPRKKKGYHNPDIPKDDALVEIPLIAAGVDDGLKLAAQKKHATPKVQFLLCPGAKPDDKRYSE